MRDQDVRRAVHAELGRLHAADNDTYIVDEMGIWSGTVRVDIAVVNGEFHGFELKSAKDTLARLSSQAEIYSQVFDRVTLVTARNHFDKAESMVPQWWGITTINSEDNGEFYLVEYRKSLPNPGINPIVLSQILWKSEMIEILEEHKIAKGVRSKPVAQLALRLAERLSLDVLRSSVRAALKKRSKATFREVD